MLESLAIVIQPARPKREDTLMHTVAAILLELNTEYDIVLKWYRGLKR